MNNLVVQYNEDLKRTEAYDNLTNVLFNLDSAYERILLLHYLEGTDNICVEYNINDYTTKCLAKVYMCDICHLLSVQYSEPTRYYVNKYYSKISTKPIDGEQYVPFNVCGQMVYLSECCTHVHNSIPLASYKQAKEYVNELIGGCYILQDGAVQDYPQYCVCRNCDCVEWVSEPIEVKL